MSAAPNVFSYLDYRSFLRDHYAHRNAVGTLSYRSFARRAGFRSPNFLKLVIDGARNLGPASVEGVARACQLDARGCNYLGELVVLRRTRSLADRAAVLERIMSYGERVELFPLERSAAEYFGRWWVPVVRELSFCDGFQDDASWIARCLGGRIDEEQARRALEALSRLGLLGDRDTEVQSVTSGAELQIAAMRRYHQQLLRVASAAVEEVEPARRDVSAITISGDAETLAEAKRMVQRFRKDLLKLERKARSRTQVFQFCLQLFPIAVTADAFNMESSDA